MGRYKAAIIGLGRIGQGFDLGGRGAEKLEEARSYAGAFGLHPRIELVAACDPNADRRRLFARLRPQARVYAAIGPMLRAERPEILAVACPTREHARAVREALGGGKPAFLILEKPFCATYGEARECARALGRARVRSAVNYSRRWLPAVRRARALAGAGRLGRPRRALAFYTKGLLHNGCHMVDFLSCFLGPLREPRLRARRAAGELDLLARAGGAEVQLLCARAREYSLNEADILFSAGRVRLCDNGRRLEVWRSRPNPWAEGRPQGLGGGTSSGYPSVGRRLELDERLSGPSALGSAMSLMLEEVVGGLDTGKAIGGCRVGEALRTLEFCERAEGLAEER